MVPQLMAFTHRTRDGGGYGYRSDIVARSGAGLPLAFLDELNRGQSGGIEIFRVHVQASRGCILNELTRDGQNGGRTKERSRRVNKHETKLR